MTDRDFTQIKELLSSPKIIVITTHHYPDGDALGSSLALYHYLIQCDHKVSVITPSGYPDFLHWMPGNDEVIIYNASKERADELLQRAEVVFCLDYNAPQRIYQMEEALLASTATKILIDHHPNPEDFTDFSLSVTSASSTAELINEFIGMLGDEQMINKDVAECIYAGVLTDTGSFSYGSTSANAHRVAGAMIEKGADNLKIQGHIFGSNSTHRMRLLGYSLSEKLTVLPDYNTAYISLSKKELKRFKFKQGDTEGLVNYCTSIVGINFAALILERDSYVKFSFRSTGNFSVNQFARDHFDGGGHDRAAGGEFRGSLEDAVKKFVDLLPQHKAELQD